MVDSQDPTRQALELARSATLATARRRTALATVARPAAQVAGLLIGGGPAQPAGPGGRTQPGTIAGGLAGRQAPPCLGWRPGDLWVPDIGVTSCDLRVLMDQPTEAISP
jgi:hypothetical protein